METVYAPSLRSLPMNSAYRAMAPAKRLDPGKERKRVDLALQGDRAAFDELVEEYKGELSAFVRRRIAQHEVDDVVQDTWLAAWNSLRAFNRRSRFKTWLFGIAVNKCRDHYRSRTAAEQRLGEAHDEVPYVDSAYRGAEFRAVAKDLLEALPATQREVMELYYLSGFTLAEVAEILERNLNTVKYQFYRAHSDSLARLDPEVKHGT